MEEEVITWLLGVREASESLFPKLTLNYRYGLGPDSLHFLRKLMLPSLESLEKFFRINQVAPWLSPRPREVAQSCTTLCDPMDCSLPCSSIHGIFQARVLEWVAISLSNAWTWKVKVKSLSRVRLCAIPWTAAYQAPPSMVFSRQEYWSGVPLPSPWSISSLTKFKFSLAMYIYKMAVYQSSEFYFHM